MAAPIKRRELLLKAHRWLGLVLALFVLVSGITGSSIVFYDEIDHALNGQALSVQAQTKALPVEQLAQIVRNHYPGTEVTAMFLGPKPDQVYSFMLKASAPGTLAHTLEVWIDPYTGTIRGERAIGALRFDRRHLMPALHSLHSSLLLGEVGETVLGVVAMLWWFTLLVGLTLALPRSGSLWKMLVIKPGASRFKFWFDSHRIIGLLALPILLLTLFCALYLTLPGIFKTAVGMLTPISPTSLSSLPARLVKTPTITAERAFAVARQAIPDGEVRGLYFHHDKGMYQLRVRLPGDINRGDGTSRLFVDMHSGAAVLQRSYRQGGTAGDRFLAWMFPLHSGQAFGWVGRLLVCLTGLAAPLLAISGVYVYLRKRMARNPRRTVPTTAGSAPKRPPPHA